MDDPHIRHFVAGLRLIVGLLYPGATGGEGRSDGRAQIRIRRQAPGIRCRSGILGICLLLEPGTWNLKPETGVLAMIRMENIEKFYPQGIQKYFVLRRVALEIKEGEFVSIMGPSGAGKSTLLHIMGMHDSGWSGEYYFIEQPIHKMSAKQRAEARNKNIGFVFQSYHLLDHLTVYENLEIPLSYRDVKKSDRQGIVGDVLDKFQIVGKKDLYPNQLSGGQQQLVGVARAVIAKPKMILADEPTGNLHSSQGKEIMELFRQLNERGTTIVQVTHSEQNASYGNRIINLADGWLVK